MLTYLFASGSVMIQGPSKGLQHPILLNSDVELFTPPLSTVLKHVESMLTEFKRV